jgi:hypothetical protein
MEKRMIHPGTDVANQVKSAWACGSQTATASKIPETVTAGGTNDGVKMTGKTIDTLGFLSCALVTNVSSKLTDTKTVSLAIEYQTSADGSAWATAVALLATTVIDTGTGSVTEFQTANKQVLKLKDLPRYIRFNVTMTLSNTATDVAHFESNCVLGGADVVPTT